MTQEQQEETFFINDIDHLHELAYEILPVSMQQQYIQQQENFMNIFMMKMMSENGRSIDSANMARSSKKNFPTCQLSRLVGCKRLFRAKK